MCHVGSRRASKKTPRVTLPLSALALRPPPHTMYPALSSIYGLFLSIAGARFSQGIFISHPLLCRGNSPLCCTNISIFSYPRCNSRFRNHHRLLLLLVDYLQSLPCKESPFLPVAVVVALAFFCSDLVLLLERLDVSSSPFFFWNFLARRYSEW